MNRTCWNIDHLLLEVGKTNGPLSRSLIESLAEDLESAISDSGSTRLNELKKVLGIVVSEKFSALPAQQRLALTQPSALSDVNSLFALGQLEFAQLLVAQVAHRRPDDEFIATLKDRRFVHYVRNLARAECTNVELASALGVEKETISRNLKKLRSLGISDYRKEGKNVINFLTPAALSLLEEVKPDLSLRPSVPLQMLEELKKDIPSFLQQTLSLSMEVDNTFRIGA